MNQSKNLKALEQAVANLNKRNQTQESKVKTAGFADVRIDKAKNPECVAISAGGVNQIPKGKK